MADYVSLALLLHCKLEHVQAALQRTHLRLHLLASRGTKTSHNLVLSSQSIEHCSPVCVLPCEYRACANLVAAQNCGVQAHMCASNCIACHADVLRALHNAVEYYTEIGRLSMAAKNLRVRCHECF